MEMGEAEMMEPEDASMSFDGINGIEISVMTRVQFVLEDLIKKIVNDENLDNVPSETIAAEIMNALGQSITEKKVLAYIRMMRNKNKA